jgi:hypothetical protein
MTDFNPLNHPILFAVPERLTPFSFWLEHIPFAMLLVDLLRPRVIVELGSHYGDSYCAFCQAVSELKTATRCYAVDNWSGDIHYGEYGPEVLEDLKSHHDPRYADFSTMLKSDFDEAVSYFETGSIDLLHIDGTHTYEAVKHDLETWLPKMSARGVVILHDTNVREGVFGVRKFFDEVKERYPNFEFLHCYGLGVLAVGVEAPESLRWLFDAPHIEADRIRDLFHTLGQLLNIKVREEELKKRAAEQAAITEEKDCLISAIKSRLSRAEAKIHALQGQLADLQRANRDLKDHIYQLTTSKGWAALEKLWRVKAPLIRLIRPFIPRKLLLLINKSASVMDQNLMVNLDSVRVGPRGAFIAEGWVFDREHAVNSLRLVVKTALGEQSFDCKYGLPRYDVKKEHKMPQALNSGFSSLGDLESKELKSLALEIGYYDGRVETVGLPVNRVYFSENGLANRDEVSLGEMFPYLSQPGYKEDTFATLLKIPAWQRMHYQDREFIASLLVPHVPNKQFTLIFDHNVGGGANYYRAGKVDRLVNRGNDVILAYYDLSRLRYKIEHISNKGSATTQIDFLDDLATIVSLVKVSDILVNNLYTYKDPLEALRSILSIKRLTGANLTLAAHDFLCVCPEINLVDKGGKFCGIPNTKVCGKCLPKNRSEILRLVHHKDMDEWRRGWGDFLKETDQILCFSNSTISLIKRAYPDLDPGKFKYQPHIVNYLPDSKPVIDLSKGLHIGVVGSIMQNKGARVVEKMAELITGNNLPVKLTVIGSIVTDKEMEGVEVTGNYRRDELPEIIEQRGVNLCLLPSIWPETFSYVAEELMLLDVPLAVFNLGAPAERVSHYSRGLILDKVGDAEAALSEIIAFHNKLKSGALPG